MKKCAHCGRLGLFFYLDGEGLCEKCSEIEKRRRLEQARIFALEQVKKASAAFHDIEENGGHFPKYSSTASWYETREVPAERVLQLREDCALICAVLKDWESTPFFIEAVHEVSSMEDGACFSSPDIEVKFWLWRTSTPEDLRQRIPKLLEKVEQLDQALERYGPYEYRSYRIVGTSFKNDDGTSRQDIIRDIKYRWAPFRDEVALRLEKYKYEDEDAIAVFANDLQLGHISRNDAQFFVLPRWDRYAGVSEYSILGGGHLSYGISIEVMFRKEH